MVILCAKSIWIKSRTHADAHYIFANSSLSEGIPQGLHLRWRCIRRHATQNGNSKTNLIFFLWNTSWHTFSKQLVWFGWSKLCRISGSIRFHVLLCYCTGRLSLDFLLSHHARPEMPVGHGNRFHNMICHAENGQKKRGTKPKPNLPSRGTHLITMFYIL